MEEPAKETVEGSSARRWTEARLVCLAAVSVFLLAWLSPVDYSDSDAAMMLVASQAWIEHGNLGFEPYADRDDLVYSLDYGDNYRLRNWPWGPGYYSLGAPMLMAPVVWVGNRLGLDMVEQRDESAWQNFVSALSCALIFVLCFGLARHFLESGTALVLSLSIVLGSSLISTLGTALWTSHFTVIAASVVLSTLLRFARRPLGLFGWGSLLVVVGVATACRPGSAFLGVALVAAFLLRKPNPSRLGWVALAAMIVVSTSGWWMEWVPFYYSPARLRLIPTVEGLNGALISPSRGLFVFSPLLLLIFPLGWRAVLRQSDERVVLIATASWVTCHAWFLVTLPMWWGGHSYGPRLMVDLIPGMLLLIVAGWSSVHGRRRQVLIGLAIILAIPSVIFNSVGGLFNPATRHWNEEPNIDWNKEWLGSWRYPQFAASEDSLRSRSVEHQEARVEIYEIGRVIQSGSSLAVFDGWYGDEGRWRWSRGPSAALRLRLESVSSQERHRLWIAASSVDEQRVAIELDGRPIGSIEIGPIVSEHVLGIDEGLLTGGGTATIRFRTPGARSTSDDPRILGVALWSMRIDVESRGPEEEAQSRSSGSSSADR